MADQSLHSPINPHFFQPLLPGFDTQLNIPVAFFSKHVKGRNDHIKTAKLRTDASAKTWLVKIDDLKFTDGWEDFAVAHDLRVGDITVFRHEGEMVFHVTALGPSCCEVQYTSSSSHNINDDGHDQTNNIVTGNNSREKKRKRMKKNPRKKVDSSSSDHSGFVANVSPSSLRLDRLHLPLSFARSNGLDKMSGKELRLLNEEGRSWKLNLKYNKASMQTYIRPGWRTFCTENGLKKDHHYPFKLVQNSGLPLIRLCRAEHEPKTVPEYRPKPVPESSSQNSFDVKALAPSSLKTDMLYLGMEFVTAHGLDKGYSEIILKNERGGRWTLALRHYKNNHTYIGPGWKNFCQVNGIKAGDSFMIILEGTGDKPVLLLSPSNRDKAPLESPEDSVDANSPSSNSSSGDDSSKSQESGKESLGDENISQEWFEMEKKKNSSRCRASSSYSKDQFVTLTLTPKAVKYYKLVLPMRFTRVNGLNKPGKITLLGKDGEKKQVVDLFQNNRNGIMRIGKGWREFCDDHGVKIGEPFVLKLIWEEEAIPVLKFCTKL